MELKNLELLLDVVRQGSFAAAARNHDLDPSSVSRAVAAMEEEVGVRLLQRTTRHLSLTEAGELYLQRVEPLVEEMDRAREEALAVSAIPHGTLRLSTSVAFGQRCIVPLLADLRATHADLKLELLLTDENVDLIAERIDLAIRLAPSVSADVIGSKLMTTRYRVCASRGYLDNCGPVREPNDLTGCSCLLFTFPAFRSRWLFRDRQDHLREIPVSGEIAISNALALRHAALAGLGPALLADWLIDQDIAEGRLVDLFPNYSVAATTFETGAWLLYPSRSFLPNKVRATIDFLRARLTCDPS
ncbi:LysR family transcriptional regulator [Pelagibius sp. Alg239-R121]|uniref:LysR family transcriptional regulator n=1 Tax=Pelagibius sp. Alg239-R121 TaxID=2993448 RepID=UPI0024A79C74|nr:LysR family transcriptional regulator [Pelagibius sp. Alg239-R121]